MTPSEFKAARLSLGLTAAALAHILGIDTRTVRRYESEAEGPSARDPNPIAVRVVEWMQAGFRPPEWPTKSDVNPSREMEV